MYQPIIRGYCLWKIRIQLAPRKKTKSAFGNWVDILKMSKFGCIETTLILCMLYTRQRDKKIERVSWRRGKTKEKAYRTLKMTNENNNGNIENPQTNKNL